ncbi:MULTISPECIES: hypothetical protein [unclassified Halomonas]|uniref:hypothetical protein n=1 Tax=unclassified Halomonas TaxID=2609666 RepID=UPI0006D96D99|nr:MULTISPECIES: hypothetical protein [unclassified Halomonas]KPQ28561.1 MAG: hypothetical protein HLUCCO06_06120 [Halomonas sp. HL-93]SBR45342.1 hypothetical protein GA0071314_0194 [Halomonas sp. HL-93]SNY98251.1 hypothetical protein SAMN04488142_2872 [Halomonas sp. hl-4]
MKYATIIMQTLTAGALVLGMAAQATAAEPTQARFDTGSPAQVGTREGINQLADDGQAFDNQGTHYRTTFDVGSPLVGGTQEGMFSERVEVEDNQAMSQQVSHTEHAENLTRGTRG